MRFIGKQPESQKFWLLTLVWPLGTRIKIDLINRHRVCNQISAKNTNKSDILESYSFITPRSNDHILRFISGRGGGGGGMKMFDSGIFFNLGSYFKRLW